MAQKRKLAIIGAGSMMFTQGLIADLMKSPHGFDWEIALCDTNPAALDAVSRLAEKMLRAHGGPFSLSSSQQRRDILSGCDYVVTTIGVGSRRAWEQDVFIPRRYGIFQPVGDTAMPGGLSRAMRMVPAMVDIARDVAALCPNAKFFNYSNPMAIICRALKKKLSCDVTGLCMGVPDTIWELGGFLGLPRERVSGLGVGINHITFVYDIRCDGFDIKPQLLEKYRACDKQNIQNRFSWEFFDKYGAFLAPGDRHVSEFFTEYFQGGAYYGKKLGVDAFSFEGTIEYGDRLYEQTEKTAYSKDELSADFFAHSGGEHEQLIEIIGAIERDSHAVYSVNIENKGAVRGVPPEAVLEMPASATAQGMRGLSVLDFPPLFAAMTNRFLAGVEIAAEAALTGSRALFAEAVMCGGYINDRAAAEKMVDELIAAHKQYLPQF